MPKLEQLKLKIGVTFAVLLFAVFLYLSPYSCIFLELFGIPCPGCGMTRALLAALEFDFQAAFSYHRMFWSLPILYLCFLFDGKLFPQKMPNVLLYVILGIGFLLNWVSHF